jgi:hypothetical protein
MNLTNVIIFVTVPRSLRPINLEYVALVYPYNIVTNTISSSRPTVMLTIILSCRLVLNLRSMSSRGGNSIAHKSGSDLPPSHHALTRRQGETFGYTPDSRGEKDLPLLPMTVDIRQDINLSTPPSAAHSRTPRSYPYETYQSMPPREQQSYFQQFPRPPRMPGMTNAN